MSVLVAPSILSADFANLGAAVSLVEGGGADWIHVDVMDGHFVPNITIGPPVVRSLRKVTTLPLDVHLMIAEPDRYLEAFKVAGATSLTVHVEVLPHLHRTVTEIRRLGMRAGVAVNPSTPLDHVAEVVGDIDILLIMSVNPGFGGQDFIPRSVERVAAARRLLDDAGSGAALEVDGGVGPANAGALTSAGATVLVAGASIFGQPDPVEAMRALRGATGRR